MNKFPKSIVVFGPSTVYGINDPEGGFVARLRSFAELHNEKSIVYNLGISGQSSRDLKARFEIEVKVRKPDLIIIYPGLNDIVRRGLSEPRLILRTETILNWQEILLSAKDICPTIFLLPLSFDQQRTTPFLANYYFLKSDAELHSQDLKSICEDLEIPYLQVEFKDKAQEKYLSADGLHPNSKGHELICHSLISLIQKFPL